MHFAQNVAGEQRCLSSNVFSPAKRVDSLMCWSKLWTEYRDWPIKRFFYFDLLEIFMEGPYQFCHSSEISALVLYNTAFFVIFISLAITTDS